MGNVKSPSDSLQTIAPSNESFAVSVLDGGAVTLDQFIAQLDELGLISIADLRLALHSISEAERPQDAESFARELVRQDRLTDYQAQQAYLGKAKTLLLGNYLILDKLGQGGMGMVLKAVHRRMERLVAIKILSPAITQSVEALRRFQQEVKVAAKLTHPNIATAYDADVAGGTHFLVMEYVEGRDLALVVATEGMLPIAAAVEYTRQAAKGLSYAHQKGVVHRDIKPANLLLDHEGTIKILDMGLARINDASHAGLTQSGDVMGTVDFMAPEQALNTRQVDSRADVYSLGCTLYRLVTGENLFAGETIVQKLLAHQQQPIPSIASKRPDIPEALADIFQRMVAKNPDDRYQSMAEVESALAALAALAAGPLPGAPVGSLSHAPLPPANSPRLKSHFSGFSGDAAPPASAPADNAPMTATISDSQAAVASNTLAGRPKSLVVRAAPPKPSHRPPRTPQRRMLIAAGFAALLLIAFGVWVIIRDKDGKETARFPVPDGGSAGLVTDPPPISKPVAPDKTSPVPALPMPSLPATPNPPGAILATDGNRDRLAAEWVVKSGGSVVLVGSFSPRIKLEELPATPFQVASVNLEGAKIEHQHLSKLSGLASLWSINLNTRPLTDAELGLLQELPNLERLTLKDSRVSDSGIRSLQRFARLKYLECGGANAHIDWEPSLLAALVENHPNLMALLGINPAKLQPNDFLPLSRLPNLNHLGLDGPVSDESLRIIVKAKSLNSITFQFSPALSDEGLAAISELPGLIDLVMYRGEYPKLTGNMLRVIADNAPQLKALTPPRRRFEPGEWAELNRLLNLKMLTLGGDEMDDNVIPSLSKLTRLERLRFFQAKISKAGLEQLHAALPRCTIESDAFGNFPSLAKMQAEKQVAAVNQKLIALNPGFDGKAQPIFEDGWLSGLQLVTDHVQDISPVREVEGLKVLSCQGSALHKGQLTNLTSLQGIHLAELDVRFNKISDLGPLKGMPLVRLIITGNSLMDISPLRGMSLTDLGMNSCSVTDLAPLKGMPLQRLSSDWNDLADLSPLHGMPLENLTIHRTLVADLSPLQECKNLKTLGIYNSKVTHAEVASLQKALPNCKIEWDDPSKATTPAE